MFLFCGTGGRRPWPWPLPFGFAIIIEAVAHVPWKVSLEHTTMIQHYVLREYLKIGASKYITTVSDPHRTIHDVLSESQNINGVLMALAANESVHPRSDQRVPGDLEIEFYSGARQELSFKHRSSGDAATSLGMAYSAASGFDGCFTIRLTLFALLDVDGNDQLILWCIITDLQTLRNLAPGRLPRSRVRH